ncbi:hypothetical protein HYQ46_001766 [Verticillium longisporum]|nr:hypothetical protein HYQ46_001766 [Verticillium longisporum]
MVSIERLASESSRMRKGVQLFKPPGHHAGDQGGDRDAPACDVRSRSRRQTSHSRPAAQLAMGIIVVCLCQAVDHALRYVGRVGERDRRNVDHAGGPAACNVMRLGEKREIVLIGVDEIVAESLAACLQYRSIR